MSLSAKVKAAFILGLSSVAVSIFFFGDGFIINLFWQGCYDGGSGHCVKSDEATYKAYKALFLFIVGIILIIYSAVNHKKV